MKDITLDVAIVGGGIAGSFLARQLRKTVPTLRIGMFERDSSTSFKVGESTVEIAGNYLVRRLGLSGYLYDHHLPKNGLRFFFDDADKNAELVHMSEIGSVRFPFYPSFQLDRARLEADLHRMNREDGIDVHLGAHVQGVTLASGNHSAEDGHLLRVETESEARRCRCRWVVDAGGRSSLIARHLGLRTPEEEHGMAAVWGRFRHVADLDQCGPDEFRKRVRYSSRLLSTNHFCYPGYWIWFIPLGRGVTSVGVVTERSAVWNDRLRKEEGFVEFLNGHRAVRSLLSRADLVDIMSYRHLAYSTSQYFSGDRWGLSGEAAAFTDPFYSPGSDFIALENDFLTDLIRRDVEGETAEKLHDRADLYSRYMCFRYEANMRLYRGLYSTLGSYELLKAKWQLDLPLYFHLWVTQYMQDLHLDEQFIRQELEESDGVLNVLSNFTDLFREAEQQMRNRGEYYRMNTGCFADVLAGIDFIDDVGISPNRYVALKRVNDVLNKVRMQLLDLSENESKSASRDALSLGQFLVRRSLK
jgi:flavin-dependent dehydrogenase